MHAGSPEPTALRLAAALAAALALTAFGALLFMLSGIYNIGADDAIRTRRILHSNSRATHSAPSGLSNTGSR